MCESANRKASSFVLQGFPGSPGNIGPAGKEGPVVSITYIFKDTYCTLIKSIL